ncbi:MAG TPA: GlsB/YeaQ/YmgE family stress response membrane protein [Chromatiales bacterium]|nr:GlsB/YeaQ/YmgE family stress response membrane protein [Thiotrichales bacterium]HIP69338.1 GlsB/YeaQ/YmgE family stress response membrane protein [Chromatiales bacterium]
MRRRIYFVLPNAATAEAVEKELLLAHIDDHHMHFMARDDLDLKKLPKANILQRTDLVHGMELGLIVGGATGLIAGTVVYLLPEFSAWLGMGIILVLALIGAVLGSWVSGMIGISAPNTRLKRFEKILGEGHVLLMVDVPKDRVDEITDLIKKHHHDAQQFGEEPTIPAFP